MEKKLEEKKDEKKVKVILKGVQVHVPELVIEEEE